MRQSPRAAWLILWAWLAAPALAQDDGALPQGPGVALVYAKCQQCHPISYVTESAGLPDFLWQDTLELMKQLGMQVSEQEEATIYQYLTTYLGTDPPPAPAADAGETKGSAGVDGASVYAASCKACHGAEGQGVGGAFPPLAGHAAALAAADRAYLPLVVLYGLAGEIEVDGEPYNGVMPPWVGLSSAEIAAVLNMLVREWRPDSAAAPIEAYTPAEIEAARGQGLSGAEVRDRRPALQ